jgi:hypothetical protein
MQASTTNRTSTGYVAIHPLDPEDAAITAAPAAFERLRDASTMKIFIAPDGS